MSKFESITKYLALFEDGNIGEWVFDEENDGTPEHPIQMPFVNYSEIVYQFIKDVMTFATQTPEMQLTNYREILERNGIEWDGKSMREADVSNVDAVCILALLVGTVRAERFCDGALLGFFNDGSIHKWLKRLKEIDC